MGKYDSCYMGVGGEKREENEREILNVFDPMTPCQNRNRSDSIG